MESFHPEFIQSRLWGAPRVTFRLAAERYDAQGGPSRHTFRLAAEKYDTPGGAPRVIPFGSQLKGMTLLGGALVSYFSARS